MTDETTLPETHEAQLTMVQVDRLQQLAQNASNARLILAAAEQSVYSYMQSVADAQGIEGFAQTNLDAERKVLIFSNGKANSQ